MSKELSIIDFYKKFSTEQACRDYLEQARWHGNPVCPRCGSEKVYKFSSGAKAGVLWKCGACKRQYTVQVGTIFEDSKIPLQKWFLAVFLATSLKKGISSLQLSRYLDITQKSAWFMLQRIRYAIENKSYDTPETGIVEVDETYVGGRKKDGKRGRGTSKTPVVGMLIRNSKVKAEVIATPDIDTLNAFVRKNAKPDSVVITDEWKGYNYLQYFGYMHTKINHSAKEYTRGSIHTNSIEGFWSHMKRGIKGIYHQISRKHTQMYVGEYVYRYNTRELTDIERFADWFNRIDTKLSYKLLIK